MSEGWEKLGHCLTIVKSYLTSEIPIAYDIARFIQSFITDDFDEFRKIKRKPYSDYWEHFKEGPLGDFQTKTGLILQEYYGMPSRIITPWGTWTILGSGFSCFNCFESSFESVIERIKIPLGLALIKEIEINKNGVIGPFWAITRWKSENLTFPVYREEDDYISYEMRRSLRDDFLESVGLR